MRFGPACRIAISMSLLLGETRGPVSMQTGHDEVASEIRLLLAQATIPGQRLSAWEHAALAALYEPGGDAALWVNEAGRPIRSASDAIELLDNAPVDGLDPSDYGPHDVRDSMRALTDRPSRAGDVGLFDVALSTSVLRYFRDVHQGRMDPRAVGFRMSAPADTADLPATLRAALAGDRLADAARGLAPHLQQYAKLRDALAHYHTLLEPGGLPPLPRLPGVVRPGDDLRAAAALRARLIALGDVRPDTSSSGDLYDEALSAGIRRFQARHGLEPDGVIGPNTQAALNVPITWRIRQIELALERLRWLPPLGDGPLVALNIPMFRLWAWDATATASAPALSMNIIVGRALDRQTPVFVQDMRYLIVRPFWNVPASILHDEILPILARDPGYLEREGFEIVRGPTEDPEVVPATADSIRRLARDVFWLRQRPGPRNALGSLKFVFPNDANVYMHGTPARELFARTRRDFSHGCVRVEDPVGLAEWALRDQPDWSRDRIVAAIEGSETQRVTLTRPIRVVIFYTTAVVVPEDGSIHFAPDLYGHDSRLDRALRARR